MAVGCKVWDSSTPGTLGSRARIPFGVWTYVCIPSVFVVSCVVHRGLLAVGRSPVQGVLPMPISKIPKSGKRAALYRTGLL
jgi:hypothetical protein